MKNIICLFFGSAFLMLSCKKQFDGETAGSVSEKEKISLHQTRGIVASNDSAFTISTYAGTGSAGSSNGTSGNPQTAQFSAPEGIVFDSNGNMFIADRDNHVIRKITTTGTVTVFAGAVGVTGAANGSATVARFNTPIRLAIDNADNLYVADRDNARIRKITPAGVVSTIAGTTTGSGSTQFNWPIDVAVTGDGSKIYVADSKNHRIQKITFAGGTYTTSLLAGQLTGGYANGTGSGAKFEYPSGVALDNSGNIVVADRYNNCIRKVTSTGVVTLLAGVPDSSYSLDAPRLRAKMGQPFGVTVANDGCIYIADITFHTIRRLSTNGFLSTVAGSGTAGSTNGDYSSFNLPTSIAIDNSGNFYVTDVSNNKIRKLTPENRVLQYTHGWNESQPHPGITWYSFHGSRFFLPSYNTNKTQYINVLDIDLSVNHLDFQLVDIPDATTITSIIGAPTTALAALSGTYATYQPPNDTHVSYLRNDNVTYWDSNISSSNQYWVYHEGMFFINSDGSLGMESSNMSQVPFNPTLRRYMMSGAPLLINNNTILETPSSPAWTSEYLQTRIREAIAARSVIAVPTISNHVLLICVDGTVPGALYCAPVSTGFGMTTADLANFVKQYFNAESALNLDGGGSASMCLKGHGDNGGVTGGLGVISYPARSVADLNDCPAHTRYANQRQYMQDAIAVVPN